MRFLFLPPAAIAVALAILAANFCLMPLPVSWSMPGILSFWALPQNLWV